MVPNGWKKGVIEDIAKVSSGGTPSRQNDLYWLGGQIPWVTTTEVKFGVINDTEQKITEAGLKNSSAKLFPKDTILMAMYGQGKTRGQVAKLGIEASTNQACAALLLNDGFEGDYYYQYLVSQYENIRELANSGGQQNLSAGIIKSIHVPIPPQLEQRKIAKILSTWDKAISTTERLIDNSKQQKKALMQQLLTGKKRLLGDSGKPFEGEWEDLYLHEVAKIIVSPVDKKTVEGEIPVELCNYTDVYYNTRITKSLNFMNATAKQTEIDKFTLQVNDVIVTKDSETPGDIAVPALVSEDLNGVVCGYHLAIIRPNSRLAEGAYLNYLFSMPKTRYYFFTLATGATRFGLSVGGINKAHFTLPPLEEQQKIASVLANSDKEIELLEQQLAALKQEKKALMQQLLTGKHRVKIDDKEVA